MITEKWLNYSHRRCSLFFFSSAPTSEAIVFFPLMFFRFLSFRWTQDDSSATPNYFSFRCFFSRIGFIGLHSWVHNKMCFLLRLSYTQGLTIPCLAHCSSVKETLPPKPFPTLHASKKLSCCSAICSTSFFTWQKIWTSGCEWNQNKQKNTFIDN